MEPKSEQSDRPALTEDRAEELLNELLDNPAYKFLLEHPKNREVIEESDSAIEVLSFVRQLIFKRIENGIVFDSIAGDEGFEKIRANPAGLFRTIESIERNQEMIGEGKDAIVVVDKNEIKEFPPEVCYKFAKLDVTPRGRNQIGHEANLQQRFYDATHYTDTIVGVPEPFYALDTGSQKIFAMERLNAVTVDAIKRGAARLPKWLDIDEVCDELEAFVEILHHSHLYHRDLHPGNIMISLVPPEENGGKGVFLIDFGLSSESNNLNPYRDDSAQGVFTFNDDCVMIKRVRGILKTAKEHQAGRYANDS
jgi:hypothetical protein